VAGGLTAGLGLFNLAHELHSTNVDIIYVVIGGLVAVVFLLSLLFAWRGLRLGTLLAGLIAFIEFGVIAAGHFVTAPWDIDVYANHEGLLVAGVLLALLPASAMTTMAAIVCWSQPRGRLANLQTVPLLIVSVLGVMLAILHTTDNVRRRDFGAALPEDGAFAVVVALILWLVGAFVIGRARRTGAILTMVGTFAIVYWFVSLHVAGGTSLSTIATKSGAFWAAAGFAMATLAAAAFVTALALLLESLIRAWRPRAKPALPAARSAGG
jgi:hypothetical protein